MSDEKKEELDDMPIWQNHEQRITALEVTTSNIQSEFKEVKEMINKGNTEQNKKLEVIDKRLMDEFFKERQADKESELENKKHKWIFATKVVTALVGGGGFIYLVVEKIMEAF